jgi:hypothetical protein
VEVPMAKKSERRNKKDPESRGNKGAIMSGDDAAKSKSPGKVHIHEHRTIQKKRSSK